MCACVCERERERERGAESRCLICSGRRLLCVCAFVCE